MNLKCALGFPICSRPRNQHPRLDVTHFQPQKVPGTSFQSARPRGDCSSDPRPLVSSAGVQNVVGMDAPTGLLLGPVLSLGVSMGFVQIVGLLAPPFVAENWSAVWTYHSLFIHCWWTFGWFPAFFAIMDKAAMDVFVFGRVFSFLWGKRLGKRWLGRLGSAQLT